LASTVFLLRARAAQAVFYRVISFVAGVLEDPICSRLERDRAAPRPRPRLRILDGERVADRVRVDARETLDDVEPLTRAAPVGFLGEVRRVDDQRVALPASDRIAQPELDAGWRMVAVHSNHTRVVYDLRVNQNVLRRLDDLIQVLSEPVRDHRW